MKARFLLLLLFLMPLGLAGSTLGGTMADSIIVVDIGGTRTRIGVWDGKNLSDVVIHRTPTFLTKEALKKPIEENQDAWLYDLKEQIDDFHSSHPSVKAISISMAGRITPDGSIMYSPNIWGNRAVHIPNATLEKMFGLSVTVSNDMSAAIVRYGKDPAYADRDRIFMITVSTGIGSKMYDIKEGRVVLDREGRIGEIGHTTIKSTKVLKDGKPFVGRLEKYASGEGTPRLAKLMALQDPSAYKSSALFDAISKEDTTIEDIASARFNPLLMDLARKGDSFSLALLRESIHHVAYALHFVVLVDAPDTIILMGGFAQHGGELYRSLLVEELAKLSKRFYAYEEIDRMVTFGIDDDNNGLIGAGMLLLS